MKKFLFIILVACIYGCSDNEFPDSREPIPEDAVKISLINPRHAITYDGTGINYANMDAKETIRMYIYRGGKAGNPSQNNLVREVTMRVLSDTESSVRGTTLCRVDDKGNFLEDSLDTSLYLTPGQYTFYAISPAIKLTNKNIPDETIYHGDTLELRTTKPLEFDIAANTPQVLNIAFDPFKLLTSRLTFTLTMGDRCEELRVDPRGIQISDLTLRPYKPNFILGNDTLILMDEDATSGLSVRYDKKVHTPDSVNYPDRHVFKAEVIPNPTGKAKDVNVRFHLLVNGGNYKAYKTTLQNLELKRGVSYNYNVKVNVSGIFLTGWTSSDWSTIIGPSID